MLAVKRCVTDTTDTSVCGLFCVCNSVMKQYLLGYTQASLCSAGVCREMDIEVVSNRLDAVIRLMIIFTFFYLSGWLPGRCIQTVSLR